MKLLFFRPLQVTCLAAIVYAILPTDIKRKINEYAYRFFLRIQDMLHLSPPTIPQSPPTIPQSPPTIPQSSLTIPQSSLYFRNFCLITQTTNDSDFKPLVRQLNRVNTGSISLDIGQITGILQLCSDARIGDDFTPEQYRQARIYFIFGQFTSFVHIPFGQTTISAVTTSDRQLSSYARFPRAMANMIASQFTLMTMAELKQLRIVKPHVRNGKLHVYHGSSAAQDLYDKRKQPNVIQVNRKEERYTYLHGGGLYTGTLAVAYHYAGGRGGKALEIEVDILDDSKIIVVNGQRDHRELISAIHAFIQPFFNKYCLSTGTPLHALTKNKEGQVDIESCHLANAFIMDILKKIKIAGTLISNFEGRGQNEFAFLSHFGSKPDPVTQEHVSIVGLHIFS